MTSDQSTALPSASTVEVSGQHFATLDGLRGIAAIAVVLYHAGALTKAVRFPHAILAVDFFFMLSGFVIAKAYEKKLLERSMVFSEFIRVRLVRLYPMIVLGVSLGAAIYAVRTVTLHSPTWQQLCIATIAALFLLPTTALLSPAHATLYPLNVPHWSLFFELMVNFVFALTAPWLTLRMLYLVCATSAAALVAVAISNNGMDVGPMPANFSLGFVRVTFPFFFGLLLYRLSPTRRVGNIVALTLLIVLVVLLLCPYFEHNWIYEFTAIAFAFPIIVRIGGICKTGPTLNRFFVGLGAISYPLYAIHEPALRAMAFGLDHFQLRHSIVIQGVATFGFDP